MLFCYSFYFMAVTIGSKLGFRITKHCSGSNHTWKVFTFYVSLHIKKKKTATYEVLNVHRIIRGKLYSFNKEYQRCLWLSQLTVVSVLQWYLSPSMFLKYRFTRHYANSYVLFPRVCASRSKTPHFSKFFLLIK